MRVVYNGAQGAEGDVRYAIWGPDIVHDPVGDRWYIYASGSTVSGVSDYQNYQTLFCIESDTAALWGGYHYAANLWTAFHETLRSDNLRPLWAVRIAVNDGSDIRAVSRETIVSMTDITPAADHITDFSGWSVVYNHADGASAAQTLADGLILKTD